MKKEIFNLEQAVGAGVDVIQNSTFYNYDSEFIIYLIVFLLLCCITIFGYIKYDKITNDDY